MNRHHACRLGIAGTALLALGLAPLSGQSQEKYPERSIRLVIPFPAGGGTDIMGGQIPLTSTILSVATPHHRSGNLGIEPVMDSSPEKAAQLVKDEIAKWAPIVRATGMKMN